ncbi:MAG: family N-acetyltransferase [Pseudarthrobacter sp.]|nr:family N-acetyltransferase [Pseudarthrobacter sp.]
MTLRQLIDQNAEVMRPAGAPRLAVTWVQTGWDHRWAVDLRGQMDVELGPRYRALVEQGRARPLPPNAGDIETVWIAAVDDKPAATAALLRNTGYWEVKRVFVSPGFRRRALAQQALEKIEGSARRLGVQELVLQTGILQPEAIALYLREGWDRIPGYGPYAGDHGSVCFRKLFT